MASTEWTPSRDSVVIGVVVGFDPKTGFPSVAFPGCRTEHGLDAKSTIELQGSDVGKQVALLFESGDPTKPMIIGKIHVPSFDTDVVPGIPPTIETKVDDQTITLTAEREIVLKCGKASVTLTRAGKIILRGEYVSSRSAGVNRIRGGSVQIN